MIRSAILFSSLQFAPQKVGSEDVVPQAHRFWAFPAEFCLLWHRVFQNQVQSWVRVRGWGNFSSAFIHRQRVPNTKTWSGGL